METSTKKNFKDLVNDLEIKYHPIVDHWLRNGKSQNEVTRLLKKIMDEKTKIFYKDKNIVPLRYALDECLIDIYKSYVGESLGKLTDSSAERIFLEMMRDERIPVRFHSKIGPYTVDYLVNGILVVELDGPRHARKKQIEKDEIRNRYLLRMGYKVLRVPVLMLHDDKRKVLRIIRTMSEMICNRT